jgi:hypothetical protein
VIAGVITGKEVVRHGGAILRSFGVVTFFRCVAALFSRRKTTFLELVWNAG